MEDLIKELLLKERETLVKRLEEVERLLGLESYTVKNIEVKGSTRINASLLDDKNFPKAAGYLQQILYIIKTKDRFLYNSEITKELIRYYVDKDEVWLKRRVSAVLSEGLKEEDNLINVRYSNSKQDTVWGNKNWINDDGSIKEEHMFISKTKDLPSKINF